MSYGLKLSSPFIIDDFDYLYLRSSRGSSKPNKLSWISYLKILLKYNDDPYIFDYIKKKYLEEKHTHTIIINKYLKEVFR